RLTGQPTPAESVIRERTAAPALPAGLTLATAPDISAEDLDAFSPEDPERVLALARKLTGSSAESLEACWASTALPYLLLNWLKDPQPLSGVVKMLAERPERTGVASEAL